ncbi:MAG: alkaline phosphatase family protein [Saprospiraceae bacterium]|nr:alkaline phosphatase family protein [Saprospiraceae bacterium]
MKNKLTLYLLADGARPDVFKRLLDEGQLPNIQREIIDRGTYRTATSVFPTTTGPAYLPMLNGAFPGTMNVTGIRWFDKAEFFKDRWSKAAKRTYVGPEAWLFNDDMPAEFPTLHEQMERPYNVFSVITRGVPKENDLGATGKSWMYIKAHYFAINHPVDVSAYERMMRGLDLNPEFFFVVFPCIDWGSHYYAIEHEQTIYSYKYLDFAVGEAVKKLKAQGRWDDTLLIITSDHGLTDTPTHMDLAKFMRRKGFRTFAHPNTFTIKPQAAVMISGNAFGAVHLLANGPEILRGDDVKNAFGVANLQELLAEPAVDFVAWRGKQDGEFMVANQHGEAAIFGKNGQGYRYQPLTADVFGLGNLASPMDAQGALDATFNSTYPDGLVQVEQLFRGSRAGDIVVSANPGYDLRDRWEIPEHKGSHGSLHREHMMVPFVYNQQGWDSRNARTADIYNTILDWMGKPTRENSDGRSLLRG